MALAKSPLVLMTELLIKAQKYMNMKDAFVAIEVGGPRTSKAGSQDDLKGQKRERKDQSSSNDRGKRRDNKVRKMVNFTPLVMPIDQILMQIKDDHHFRWLEPLNGSPNARNKKKYCRFHRNHGHYIDECRDLKEQIEELIQNVRLQKFVKKNTYGQPKQENRTRSKDKPKDDDKSQERPKNVIGEIRMINGCPTVGGFFKSFKKSHQR